MRDSKKEPSGPVYPAHLNFTANHAGKIMIGVVFLILIFAAINAQHQSQIVANNITCTSTDRVVERSKNNFYLQMDCGGYIGFIGNVVEIAKMSRLGGKYRCKLRQDKQLVDCQTLQ